jgi:HlyD family secretion protein
MRRAVTIGIIVVVIIAAIFAFRQFNLQRDAQAAGAFQTETAVKGSLTATVGATGIVESNQNAVLIWQTTGTVAEVLIAVGDRVEKDQVLATLSKTSLPQNLILAQPELVSAQKALDDLLTSALPRAQAQLAVKEAQEALDTYAVNQALQLSQAELALATARNVLEDTEYRWRVQQEGQRATGDTINAAEANLVLAEKEVENAQKEYNKYSGRDDDDPVRALTLSNLSGARQQRDALLRQLNWYTGKPTDSDQAILDAQLAAAEAELANAEAVLDLLAGGPDPADIALLEAQLADAEAALARVADGPNPDDIAAAEARVAAAQATLDLGSIAAPFSGTVTEVNSKAGDQVGPSTLAFRLDDISSLLVRVDVSEIDINRILVGQAATLTFDAILDKDYEGIVREVGLAGAVVQGTVNFKITIEILNPDSDVKPGMTAAVNMIVNELNDVLLVPNRAVRIREGSRVVFIMKNGVPEAVNITLGASSETVSEVSSGDLQPGDEIVLNPPAEPLNFGPPGGGPGGGP